MEDYPLCACGCGERVKRKGSLFKGNHKSNIINYITITNEHLKNPILHQMALDHMRKSVIDVGYLSKNKSIKSNCQSTRPIRGQKRLFIDRYITISFTSPYNPVDYFRSRISRLAAMLYIGDIPEGQHALHKCDVKMCCNPDHIYIGTQGDNQRDTCDRRGNYKPNGLLTRYECESIKYHKKLGEHTLTELATYYNCSMGTVYRMEERQFTTDGSEVIGNIFIPKIIPEAKRVTKVKQAIKLGKELSELHDKLKTKYPYGQFIKHFVKDCKTIYGISRSSVYIYTLLYKTNIHRINYKYGWGSIYRMIRDGVDLSVPV